LKVKESDRIAAMEEGLAAMGADITATDDGWVINGPRFLEGARVSSHGDHRVAMALAVASLIAGGKTEIDDAECVDISYPSFFDDLEYLC
ncbi:MAG: 3-phosphoshikimate 1-carboxyvinyltransferase, partial [Candidatus Dormibacteraceae bacterium]